MSGHMCKEDAQMAQQRCDDEVDTPAGEHARVLGAANA